MSVLDGYSDEQLREELKRRELLRRAREEADHTRRAVEVHCPFCSGKGAVPSSDTLRVASGESEPEVTCPLCRGKKTVTALALEVLR